MALMNPPGPNDLEEIALLVNNLADKVLADRNGEAAWNDLYRALSRIIPKLGVGDRQYDIAFVQAVLQLSNMGFALGKGFDSLVKLLKNAQEAALRLGDRRSHCMINLHLGRLYYLGEKRLKAMDAFILGKEEAEELGDEDILSQAAEFIGLYYFLQGLFQEARPHLEQATQIFEFQGSERITNPSGPVWLGLLYSYLGEYHRAIGTLDYFRRIALNRSDHSMAALLQALLGHILATIRQFKEAHHHLTSAQITAGETQNHFATYISRGGFAVIEFLQGRIATARDLVEKLTVDGMRAGIIRQYASPISFEMLFHFHINGLKPIPELNFHREFQRCMAEPNIHLRGVALRLKAVESEMKEEDHHIIASGLSLSEEYLERAGNPIELGKTHLELARLKLRQENQSAARSFAQKAWKEFSGYAELFYPDDLRHLIDDKKAYSVSEKTSRDLLPGFSNIIKELLPKNDVEEILSQIVASTNRFFSAERGALFWFGGKRGRNAPELRIAHNLLKVEVSADSFQPNLSHIFQAYRENRPLVFRNKSADAGSNYVKAVLCVPIEVAGHVNGILYHDNSYLDDCFDEFSSSQLITITNTLSAYIEQIIKFGKNLADRAINAITELGRVDSKEIISQSPIMRKIIAQADQVAATDSTVLILGETGVGKELLARRIHQMSLRKDKPMVVVDPTALPENLVESELFGYEKGAFTGADSQKKGLIELAHQGTLFIDEVGEIPKYIQPKLLRTLQEKTTVRIGGTKHIKSDFRLVAATNRNLNMEVAEGRFREDLYYRINVIPLVLPPLRDRLEDVPLLARHFLDRFALKYNRPKLQLTSRDESMLTSYKWPGNVRELNNIIERTILLSIDESLELNIPTSHKSITDNPFEDMPTFHEIQRRYIEFVLNKTNGKLDGPGGATKILDMKRQTLYNCMKRLGLR
jgi:transcriptional regulator with GAF, ATPase, and Fis domain